MFAVLYLIIMNAQNFTEFALLAFAQCTIPNQFKLQNNSPFLLVPFPENASITADERSQTRLTQVADEDGCTKNHDGFSVMESSR